MRKFTQTLDSEISYSTVYNYVRKTKKNPDGLYPYKYKIEPRTLNLDAKTKRLDFALKYQNEDWKKYGFEDEFMFE